MLLKLHNDLKGRFVVVGERFKGRGGLFGFLKRLEVATLSFIL